MPGIGLDGPGERPRRGHGIAVLHFPGIPKRLFRDGAPLQRSKPIAPATVVGRLATGIVEALEGRVEVAFLQRAFDPATMQYAQQRHLVIAERVRFHLVVQSQRILRTRVRQVFAGADLPVQGLA